MRLTTNYDSLLIYHISTKFSTNNCAVQQLGLRMIDQLSTTQNTPTN
jgi:hypothetical protein